MNLRGRIIPEPWPQLAGVSSVQAAFIALLHFCEIHAPKDVAARVNDFETVGTQ